jgi:hypothetical protein
LGGCLSIKSQSTSQRAPGVVSLEVAVCASDYNQSTYTTCRESNTAESDDVRLDADGQSPSLGQILVGFRVPDGSTGPASFLSDAQDVSFSRSESYTDKLDGLFPPGAGKHWEGYISTAKTFDPDVAATRQTSFRPEFSLPPEASGEPFVSPYRWRVVAGFRPLSNVGQSATPVSCSGIHFCADSPPNAEIPSDLQAAVSDFGVLPGTEATAGHGQTATASFPVRYLDTGGLGAQELRLTASTDLPGAGATPETGTLSIAPGATQTVRVTVPVPPGTPLGAYQVTLSAATGSPAVTRSNTATIHVVDRSAPGIRISTPAEGATFLLGASVGADYACTDEFNGSGVGSCSGPVPPGAPIDTGSVGPKTFTVNALDFAGNPAAASRTYTVVAPPPRRIVVTLAFAYRRARGLTRFTRLKVRRVPRGSRVRATCARKRSKCPRKARKAITKRRASGSVNLKRFLRVRLRPGTKITVRVTKRGSVGAVKILTVRRRKPPRIVDRCIPPGSKRVQRRC